MGIQKLLIGFAILGGLVIMIFGVVSLNHIVERLNNIEDKMNNVINELYILSGDTTNTIPDRGSLAGIEERLVASHERTNGVNGYWREGPTFATSRSRI